MPSRRAYAVACAAALVAAVLGCVISPAVAQVAVSPPTATAFFSQATVTQGTPVGFGVTVVNTAVGAPVTGLTVAVTLPANLVIATPGQLFSSCGGTATAPDGGSAISLSGGSLQSGGDEGDSCVLLVDVVATQAGVYQVATGAPSSVESGPGSPSNTASLTVGSGPPPPPPVDPPTVGEAFGAPSIKVGDKTSLTYTLANPNAADVLYNVNLDDTLPAGLSVAAQPNIVETCPAGNLVANPGDVRILVVGVELAASASCTFAVDVIATAATSAPNPTGPVTFSYDAGGGDLQGASGPGATATLVGIGPPKLIAAFSPATISFGTSSLLVFTLSNPNATTALSGIGFSGTLPGGLTKAAILPPGPETCGVQPGPGATFGMASVTLAPSANCLYTFGVTGPPGNSTTTTSAISSVEGGSGAAASAALTITPAAPPPPPPPPAPPKPSNLFTITKLRAAGDGTVRFDMKVPGAGEVAATLTRPKKKPKTGVIKLGTKKLRPAKAATLHVKVLPTRTGRSIIRKAGKRVRVGVVIAFKPKGGSTRTVNKTVTVRRR